MLQNNVFPIFDKKYNKFVDGYVYNTHDFCKRCIKEKNKKCENYYNKINSNENIVMKCPYGLTTIIYNGNIFSSIVVKENIDNKTKKNFENEIKKEIKYSEEQAISLIKKSVERDEQLERYRETVHDLRNMASYFNSMIDDFKEEKQDKELTSSEMSLISLYELINFRLDILYGKVDLTNIIEKQQKLHPIVAKLKYLLKYKARQKDINIIISNKQDNYFEITKSLYLALFILMENSIKYAIPSTTINIDFIENNESSTISISNVSNKIETQNSNELIQKGVRGSNAIGLGSGIGLAFANELLTNMGAMLEIEINELDNNQSKFTSKITIKNPIK